MFIRPANPTPVWELNEIGIETTPEADTGLLRAQLNSYFNNLKQKASWLDAHRTPLRALLSVRARDASPAACARPRASMATSDMVTERCIGALMELHSAKGVLAAGTQWRRHHERPCVGPSNATHSPPGCTSWLGASLHTHRLRDGGHAKLRLALVATRMQLLGHHTRGS